MTSDWATDSPLPSYPWRGGAPGSFLLLPCCTYSSQTANSPLPTTYLHDIVWQKAHLRPPQTMHTPFLKALVHTWDKLFPKLLPHTSRFMPFVIKDCFLKSPTAKDIDF